jgi:DNA polymerase-4
MKLLCILLPHFPLKCEVLAGRSSQNLTVIAASQGSQRLVLDFSSDMTGLEYGMNLQQALSIYGEMKVLHADLLGYWKVFDSILDNLEKCSPLVEGVELGTAYLGLAGLEPVYGTDDALVDAVKRAIPPAFEVRLGIADGKFVSRISAMLSTPGSYNQIEKGGTRLFLRDLSCDLLPISSESRTRLHDFGLYTMAAITSISPAQLQAQFGLEGHLIYDLACGLDDTPLYPRAYKELIEESAALPSATVSIEMLMTALEAMLNRAFIKLSKKKFGISSIKICTRTWLGEHWEETVRFKEPAMNLRTSLSRIKQVMANTAQPGPIEAIDIKITGTRRFCSKQKSLMNLVKAQEHFLEEIRQLEFRLGGAGVFQIKDIEPWSRMPERRYALSPVNSEKS